MKRTMILTRDFPFPQDRVWRAISTGALMAEWLMPNDFLPEPGHSFTFRAAAQLQWDGVVHGTVLQVDPPHRLSYSWVAMGVVTEVALRLEPTPDGTRLTVSQSGFTNEQSQNYAGARYGWTNFLNRLSNTLEAM